MRFDVVTYHLLTTLEGIRPLAGVFPNVVPGNVSLSSDPVIAYSQVSNTDVTTKQSYNDYSRAIVQLSIFGKSYDDCRTLADAIKSKLDRYDGGFEIGDVNYKVDLIRFQNQHDLGFDEENNVYMIAQDYLIAMNT